MMALHEVKLQIYHSCAVYTGKDRTLRRIIIGLFYFEGS